MNATPHRLSVEGLATGYPGRPVGENLSFELAGSQVMALLGPNGSGKTTLFRTILGLTPGRGGHILVDGDDISDAPLRDRARLFGYVPQQSSGFFPYSVREMVLMGRTPHIGMLSAPSARDREAADAAIERTGIAALAGRDINRISGGERQLAMVARALAQEPAFLVMDEPTASLDFANQHRTLELIRNLAAEGLGIILSTHHPDQALAVATHAALMAKGGLIASGAATEVLTSERLSALFGMRLAIAEVAGTRLCVAPAG